MASEAATPGVISKRDIWLATQLERIPCPERGRYVARGGKHPNCTTPAPTPAPTTPAPTPPGDARPEAGNYRQRVLRSVHCAAPRRAEWLVVRSAVLGRTRCSPGPRVRGASGAVCL